MNEQLLSLVTEHYLKSRDFNGIRISNLESELAQSWDEILDDVRELIDNELVGVITTDDDVNPAIIRTGFRTKEEQVSILANLNPNEACLYPRPNQLEVCVDRARYAHSPYELCMALGEPQLTYRSFDVSILEYYRNDPRYYYQNNDLSGSIGINDDYYENGSVPEHDQILLHSFGFSYNEKFNRAVAVFLRYLSNLSPEHQQVWKAKEIRSSEYRLHPEYFKASIIGDWPDSQPIFLAFGNEMALINKMTVALGRPKLFRLDFGEDNETRPRKFGFLVRPTLEEYNSFILLLDKLMSENINKEFFRDDVVFEKEIERGDGRVEVRNKGMIDVLDEWMRTFFSTDDWVLWEETITAFKKIRRMRQRPAHAIDENKFDQKYFVQQRELIINAYSAIRTIRLIFENHPMVLSSGIEVPDWLKEGKILAY